MFPTFSICHTTARPNGWQDSYRDWVTKCSNPSSLEYILCIDKRWGFTLPFGSSDFPDNCPQILYADVVLNTKRKCSVDGWNIAVSASTGKIIILNSDDVFPCEGWDEKLLESYGLRMNEGPFPAPNGDFVIETTSNTPADKQGLMVVQILSRARYERLGYAMYPEYESMYADNDFTEHARLDGVVINAKHIVIEHRHPSVTGAKYDLQYLHENQPHSYAVGEKILRRRRKEGFKDNPVRLKQLEGLLV